MRTKRLTLLAILLAISIVLSIVESMIPIPIPVPGVKLGLANVVTILILFIYGDRDAFTILLLRIILVGLLRGNIFSVTFFLSLSGGMVAYLMMFLFKHLKRFNIISISIMGAFGHSVGQIVMAIFIIERRELIFYFPYILVLSIVTGVFTGMIATRSLQIMKKAL
ncbi:Gx transporter family protein [Candidatus Xianfuyuplasma coldseepsis]|uniref:Gx transporter family protein n=1 Tax=Candidatus Xianfuyuplasma coldseepsis TaxID=2782163 RepID=A0A7L7KP46_9MOLU|nr:Gx transporter family protein [Xianfuyuplasma coldseepsis]QMS84473.1 Gx transporter family protein [Xianfuyuplasma coldseepsis]